MSSPLRRVFAGIAFFLLTCLAGVACYLLAGWSVMDSIYMVVITIFGVGYGEVNPVVSPALRTATILLIVVGYAAAVYTVGGFVQMLMEGELNRALNQRRMTKGIGELERHTVLCGFGRAGRILAKELAAAKAQFVVVDQDPAKLNEAEQEGYLIVEGNASDDETLIQAGVRRARALASVLPDDATNVFITLTARELNPDMEIIARAEHPSTETKLIRSGATKVVLPAVIGGMKMAHLIVRPSTEEFLKETKVSALLHEELEPLGLRIDELPVAAGTPIDGRLISELELRGNRGFLVVAVRQPDGTVVVDPAGDYRLSAGDSLIVLGHHNEIPELARRYTQRREGSYRGTKVVATS